MNPSRLIHRANIHRRQRTVTTDGKTSTALTLVATGVRVLAEALGAKQHSLLVGRAESAQYTMTWMQHGLQSDDEVTLTTPSAGAFILKDVVEDHIGGYFIGHLEAKL